MDITVVGLGYVGAVAVGALSKAGHNVLGVDVDQGKVSSFQGGICPFYEPSSLNSFLPAWRQEGFGFIASTR